MLPTLILGRKVIETKELYPLCESQFPYGVRFGFKKREIETENV